MGIYGNKFIEREVTLEDAIIQFESECNQYSKIFESVNILNESGIILEFSFKDIIEKIKDFFRMIGRKIKELWDKIFHRNKSIDEKIEEAEAKINAAEEYANDSSNNEEFFTNDELKDIDHELSDDHKSKNGKWIRRPFNPEIDIKSTKRFKDIKFTSNGKSVNKKIKVKLSKKALKELEVEYHVLPKFTTLNPSIGAITVLHDVVGYFRTNLKKDSLENIFEDEDFNEDINDLINGTYINDKNKTLETYTKEYDLGIFQANLSTEKATINKAKEYLVKQSKELDVAIDHAKNSMKLFEETASEQEKVAAGLEKLPENVRDNPKLSSILSKAASKDIATCKTLFTIITNYYNGLLRFKSTIASDLDKIANMVTTEVK